MLSCHRCFIYSVTVYFGLLFLSSVPVSSSASAARFLTGYRCQGYENSLSQCSTPVSTAVCPSVVGVTCRGPYTQVTTHLSCHSSCMSGWLRSGAMCVPCASRCLECQQAVDRCTSCSAGLFLNGTTCVSACPAGMYGDTSRLECLPCSSACDTCADGTANNVCTSCAANGLLEHSACVQTCTAPLFASGGQCLASCPSRSFAFVPSRECRPCPSDCTTCSIVNSIVSCLQCIPGSYLTADDSQCIATCPDGSVSQAVFPPVSDVRLVAGQSGDEGRLEVKHANEWGTVCNDGWTAANTDVVCRSLGYESAGSGTSTTFQAALVTSRVWLENVRCRGSEGSIQDCRRSEFGQTDCLHSADIGIACNVPSSQVRKLDMHESLAVTIGQLFSIHVIIQGSGAPTPRRG